MGVHRVGYVMICFGVVNAACSLVFGSLMKFVGRQPLMALGAIVHASLVVVLLHWKPHPDNPYVFYTVSGLWGVGDAVWQTQVNGECLRVKLHQRTLLPCFSWYHRVSARWDHRSIVKLNTKDLYPSVLTLDLTFQQPVTIDLTFQQPVVLEISALKVNWKVIFLRGTRYL